MNCNETVTQTSAEATGRSVTRKAFQSCPQMWQGDCLYTPVSLVIESNWPPGSGGSHCKTSLVVLREGYSYEQPILSSRENELSVEGGTWSSTHSIYLTCLCIKPLKDIIQVQRMIKQRDLLYKIKHS
jgi:hypothetical protein